MKREQIRDWIRQSFQPITLSLPQETIEQVIDSAILYWNTHSAYKTAKMYPLTGYDVSGGLPLANFQLDADIKTVVGVYPSAMEEEVFSNHPMWVLLGFITLDRYTNDLMLLSHTFEGYKIYLGNDFRWKWMRSEDSTKGGWLYLQQVPREASKVAVIGTKRILAGEDITDEFIYGWIREYARAQVKALEGNVLRKAQIINIANDGNDMVKEGLDRQKELEEQLRKEGRWLMLAKRQ